MDNLTKELIDFYRGKKVLVTGGTGFKGTWLIHCLHQFECEVVNISLKPNESNDIFITSNAENKLVSNYYSNILNEKEINDIFKKEKPEIVFHLAAQALVRYSYEFPKETYEVNVIGSLNILEAIRNTDSVKSLIYVTSDKAYENNEWIWGYRENDRLGGYDPYSSSKAAAEILFSSYNKSFFSNNKIGYNSVRAGNVIGGGDNAKDRIIPDCINSFLLQNPIELRNPNATRPWQHVLEPLSGYLIIGMYGHLNPKKFNGSWNFGPKTSSVKTVKELVIEFSNYFDGVVRDISTTNSKLHEAGLLHLNCDKANQKLKWYPKWNFKDTVKHTAHWYKKVLNGSSDSELETIKNIKSYFQI